MYLVAFCRTVLMVFIESLNTKGQKMKMHCTTSSWLLLVLSRPYTIKHAGAEFIKLILKLTYRRCKDKLTRRMALKVLSIQKAKKHGLHQSIFGMRLPSN